jgi:DNA repair protein RecO (recombination protein O)
MITLFTEAKGIVTAAARSARRSGRRFAALEPIHLLHVTLDERSGSDVATLVESVLLRPRLALVTSLDGLEAAGKALRWIRRAVPASSPEPELWTEINGLLDALDAIDPRAPNCAETCGGLLVRMGLRMLSVLGFGLELNRCVRCERPCPDGATACFSPSAGGIICRACGGAPGTLRGALRNQLVTLARGEHVEMAANEVDAAIATIDAALVAHA